MTNRRLATWLKGATATAILLTGSMGLQAKAEDQIRAVAAFPKPLAFTQSFLGFIKEVNTRGKGIVKITYMGGPEIFPSSQQIDAVKRGVVDMHYGPATYHLGTMAEADAWVGSTVTAAEARKNGGFAIMQEAFKEKLGVQLLAHIDSGIQFHIYTLKEPKRTKDGSVDLKGLRLRSVPIYKNFFESRGAVPVSVPVPDVYTGLERNTFDGVGWPVVAIQDLSWDKFLKYRIDPGFFATDLNIVINPKKWAGLSEKSRKLITEIAAEYEVTSHTNFQKIIADTDKAVQAGGMKIIKLKDDAAKAYLDQAFESAWSRLKASKTPRYDALRKAYYSR